MYNQAKPPGNGRATAAVVCGIIGVFLAGLILGVIAILLGASAKKLGYQGGKATAGVVLGIIDLIGGTGFLIFGSPF